jgi:hypothetical protein
MNWFPTVLFDAEIRLQDNWVKLCIYWPVSRFPPKRRISNFVNLTIPGGIGPIQSQGKILVHLYKAIPSHDYWVKLWTYRPVSLFVSKWSCCKFVNFMISGRISPVQKRSQDKPVKKREMANHHNVNSPVRLLTEYSSSNVVQCTARL